MRKTIRKMIFIWNFDKEEKWLNEMAAKGLSLISVGFCKYEFEDSMPGEYKICMQLLDKCTNHPESEKYIEFIESTGAEHVGTFNRWVYFRRRSELGSFELFSDYNSRINYLSKVIGLIAFIAAANLLVGAYNIFIALAWRSCINYLGIINLCIAVWGVIGSIRLIKKRMKLKQDSKLFEQ